MELEEVKQNLHGLMSLRIRTERCALLLVILRPFVTVTKHYLGHSINAPTGRWQKNKDVHWYSRREQQKEDGEREEEIRKIKELEANALSAALYVPNFD